MDYEKHNDVLQALKECQDADYDNRESAREAHLFVDGHDGQWEPGVVSTYNDRPRYTFDLTTPIVDQIAGDLEETEFNIKIRPAGGEASKDSAKLLDGLVRNIENVSNFDETLDIAGRDLVAGGITGWVVKHKYVDDDSFHQDLIIEPIANVVDSVWLGPFTKPDGSDAKYGFVLEAIPKEEYEKRWPEGKCMSVDQGRSFDTFEHKAEHVVVGQAYYLKPKKRELVMMNTGQVYFKDEIEDVLDEMAQAGVQIADSRMVEQQEVKTRLFDGGGWLNDEQDTVFTGQLPIVLALSNLKFFEDKCLYRGAVTKLMDAQRVFNYAKSREVEEGALAPRDKYWMTPKQAAGHEKTLASMNTNADPVQFFNPDPEAPGAPTRTGGAAINPGLNAISTDMKDVIRDSAGLHAANLGDNPQLQSGIAIKRLQDRGDVGSSKYFKAMERAIARTGRILVDAIPKVYDTPRQVRILQEDGSYDMTMLNQQVFDQQSGQMVTLNDVCSGKYDVVCDAGVAFDNRQQETVDALTSLAQYDPSIIEMGGDVLYQNITAPGMDQLAERKRQQLFNAGVIPFEQMTDEEKQQFQQAQQQPPPPDPAMILAQAELEKANADKEANQVKMAVEQRKVELEALKLQIAQGEQQLKAVELQGKAQRDAVEMESQQIENAVVARKFGLDAAATAAKTAETRAKTGETKAKTLKTMKETALMGRENG